MQRASTPLKDNNNHVNLNPNTSNTKENEGDDELVDIPLMVLELSAPPSPQIYLVEDESSVNNAEVAKKEGSPAVSIHLIDEGAASGKEEVKKAPTRKQSYDNDTSWGKIKKKTSRKHSAELSTLWDWTSHSIIKLLHFIAKPSLFAVAFVKASMVWMYLVMSAMFVFGCLSINACTANPLIPVYLIVAGSTGILTRALIRTQNKYLFNVVILLVLFDLCWQAFGSWLVYSVYQPNYDIASKEPHCHRIAYLLAFWIITIVYVYIGLFILLSGCYFLMRNTFRKS